MSNIKLPEKCLRTRVDCEPLSQIESDCKVSFYCCGLSDKESRTLEQDEFRFCFKNDVIDEINDYDFRDMVDTISVMSQALSAKTNREYWCYHKMSPVKVTKIGKGKCRVTTPSGTKAKSTSCAKARRQANLLRGIEHGFKPTGKKARR